MSTNRRTRSEPRLQRFGSTAQRQTRSQPRPGNYTLKKNNIYVLGRNATEANVPLFEGKIQKGKLKGPNAKAELVLPGQLLDRNNQMVGFTKAKKLRRQWVTKRADIANPVALQQRDSMEQGTICMIDKNGACIPIGFTDPQYTTRSTESMQQEVDQIMSDPNAILQDIQRAQQLLRMIHTRQRQEYTRQELRRQELRRERSLSRLVENGTRRIRGLFSGPNARPNAGGRRATERRNARPRVNAGGTRRI